MSHIRIESDQKVVTNAKIFFVDGDTEVDISSCVQVVDIHLGVGELATAELHAILGHASVTAQVDEVFTTRLPKPRRRWRRRLREITSFSDRTRRWS